MNFLIFHAFNREIQHQNHNIYVIYFRNLSAQNKQFLKFYFFLVNTTYSRLVVTLFSVSDIPSIRGATFPWFAKVLVTIYTVF